MDYANVALALFAGLLSILSPCVLPLVPVVLGSAVSEHRLGPLALAAGLATSFTAIGIFVATIGYSVGLDGEFFRVTGAVLLVAAGFALMLPRLQIQFALAAAPLGNWTKQKFGSTATAGLRGQFGVGLLLGAVWSPCVGPTLGAASVLAAQGRSLGLVALTMLFFGLGSAVPLIALGLISREAMMRAASPSLGRHKWQDSSGRHPDRQRLAHPV
jgi:cytochrome c-type biogenesis protein